MSLALKANATVKCQPSARMCASERGNSVLLSASLDRSSHRHRDAKKVMHTAPPRREAHQTNGGNIDPHSSATIILRSGTSFHPATCRVFGMLSCVVVCENQSTRKRPKDPLHIPRHGVMQTASAYNVQFEMGRAKWSKETETNKQPNGGTAWLWG